MRQFRVCDSVEAYGLEKALDKACIDLDRVDKMSGNSGMNIHFIRMMGNK